MKVTFIDHQTHLLVVCEGVWDPIDATDVIRRIGAESRRSDRAKVLVDWRDVSMPPGDHFRALAGEDATRHLAPPLQIAVLFRKSLINKVAEQVAIDGGVNIWIHHDPDELLDWLK